MLSLVYCFVFSRNFLIIIGLTTILGTCLLLIVYILNLYLFYRAKFKLFTNSKQREEALRNLLERNELSSGLESEEDTL